MSFNLFRHKPSYTETTWNNIDFFLLSYSSVHLILFRFPFSSFSILSVFTHVVVPNSIMGVKDLRKLDYMYSDDSPMTQDVCVACGGGKKLWKYCIGVSIYTFRVHILFSGLRQWKYCWNSWKLWCSFGQILPLNLAI